jgi:hypothetical protein
MNSILQKSRDFPRIGVHEFHLGCFKWTPRFLNSEAQPGPAEVIFHVDLKIRRDWPI